MSEWFGRNWQLIETEDTMSTIGVTLGTGLLDEPVEATGSLAIAAAALRAELSRAVELGAGVTGTPEVAAELGTDTLTLSMRGNRDTVAAAWARLPDLFVPETVTKNVKALVPEHPVWAADLVQRTGRNAAALSWLKGTVADARKRARGLLRQLDPAAGQTSAVFFTTDPSLVGHTYPVRSTLTPRSGHWADGTPLPVDDALNTNAAATVLGTPTVVVLSALVPRSRAGLAAARVLLRRIGTLADEEMDTKVELRARALGLGPDVCVFVIAEPRLRPAERARLLRRFTSAFPLVPDPWLEEVVADAAQGNPPWLDRERRLLGLADDPGADVVGVRHALARARATMHLAVDEPTIRQRPRRDLAVFGGDDEPVPGFRAAGKKRQLGRMRRFVAWSRTPGTGADTVHELRVADTAVLARTGPAGQKDAWRWQPVDTDRLLAVLEDRGGELTLIDEGLRGFSFYPEQFWRTRALRRLLAGPLEGATRFTLPSGDDRAKIRKWARRGKGMWIGISTVSVLLIAAIVAGALGDRADTQHAMSGRLEIGETAQLANGTTITPDAFDISWPNPDDPEFTVTVNVEFCAGGDTTVKGAPPETQRSVSPDDFRLFGENQGYARALDDKTTLQAITLQKGQCTTGKLAFKDLNLQSPRLSYVNAADDDVIWYPYGQVPKK